MLVLSRRDVLLGFASSGFAAATAPTASRDWLLLGTAVVPRAKESVDIHITAWQRSFAAIKLAVSKDGARKIRGVRIKTLTLTFADGERVTKRIQSIVEVGAAGPPLLISERKRSIRHVRMTYALVPSHRFVDRNARGTVELWGRR